MNTYTIDQIETIYSGCTSFDDVEAASKAFHFLISNGYQDRSEALQQIAIERLRKFI